MIVTPTAKEYLMAIGSLAEEGRPVIAARLAERLRVTAPTVHQMLQKLKEQRLIETEARRGITLTAAGLAIAAEGQRRQRLAERWLTEMLGLDWADAHAAARAMEAAISPTIADRLATQLGHPTTGRLAEGAVAEGAASPDSVLLPLDQLPIGSVVMLERIAEGDDQSLELLGYLDRRGVRPGARLTIAAIDLGAQTVTLRRGDAEIVLGRRAAGQLWARRLTADELARLLLADDSECPDEANTFVAEVIAVKSECPAGHQLGDRFHFGQRTPCGMCADAFVTIYPHLGELPSEPASNAADQRQVPCPEHGNVTFRVRRASASGTVDER